MMLANADVVYPGEITEREWLTRWCGDEPWGQDGNTATQNNLNIVRSDLKVVDVVLSE